jgi:hypothetical protein
MNVLRGCKGYVRSYRFSTPLASFGATVNPAANPAANSYLTAVYPIA